MGATSFDPMWGARSWRTSARPCPAQTHLDILGIETANLKIRSSAKGSFFTGAIGRSTFKTNNCFHQRSNSRGSRSVAKNTARRRTFYTRIVARASNSTLRGEFWNVSSTNLPTPVVGQDGKMFHFEPIHKPLECCYAHTEVWCRSGGSGFIDEPSRKVRETFRVKLAQRMTVRIQAGP